MAFKNIPVFDGGLVTFADPEDIEDKAATVSINFETDVPGKLIKRQGRGDQATMSGRHVDQIVKWTHQDLAAPIWVIFEPQEAKIIQCATNFTSIADIKDLSTGTPATTIEINNYGNRNMFKLQPLANIKWLQNKIKDKSIKTI